MPSTSRLRRLSLSVLLLPLAGIAWAQSASTSAGGDGQGSVRIYRCAGSGGAVSLQNVPCENGQPQQVRDMQRPRDPPPRATTTLSTDPARAAAAPAPLPQREIRIVTVQPPQPMYECVTEDGERYTSDSNEGNPRWVPIWTVGYVGGYGPGHRPGRGHGGGERPRPVPVYPGAGVVVPAGSTLVRDVCNALPPQEVCARLADRRWELIRRYNSALQSERRALETEQRGIDARLDRDCGGS